MQRIRSLFPRIVIIFIYSTFLWGCEKSPLATDVNEPQLQSVSSKKLQLSSSYANTQVFSGSLRAGNTSLAGFELAGKINQLLVDSGADIKKDQILAKLDTQLLKADQQAIAANLLQNSAELDLAQKTLARNKKLNLQGYTSAQIIDDLESQLLRLNATRNSLLAAKKVNQLKLNKSILRAPFNGKISLRHQSLGEVVAAGAPVFTLIQANNQQAIIGVSPKVSAQLSLGQELEVQIQEKRIKATVAGIASAVNAISRTVDIRLTLPPSVPIMNGQLVRLHYQQQINQQGFWVPMSALTDGIRGLWNIYVATKVAPDTYKLELRNIEIIYSTDNAAYINGALKENEHFITAGLHKLVAGQRVQLNHFQVPATKAGEN